MAVINLRKHYYPLYTKDTFIEVPDEDAAVMEECRLYENRQEGRKSYYHVYSMDCSTGIENHAMFLVQSPEDLIIREIDETAEELLLAHLAEAIIQLSPTQARRLHARYALKKKFREIAADEGVSGSCATESVTSAVRKLRKIFAQNGWLEKEPPMANKLPNATAGMTFPRPKPDTPPSMVKKIGKTTYLVWAHFSETSTETMEDKIKRMLREEVRQMMADE